jgi:hypothetical protein
MPGSGWRKSGYKLGWPMGSCWADDDAGPMSGPVREKKRKEEGNRKWFGWRIWPKRVLGLKKKSFIFLVFESNLNSKRI